MKVIIPLSGEGTRFIKAGYRDLKPLIPIDGKPILQHLVEKFPVDWPKVFICSQAHLEKYDLKKTFSKICPQAEIIAIEPSKRGPVGAVLTALFQQPHLLKEDEPCLINYCDFSFSWDSDRFTEFVRHTQCDGAILCYKGFHPEYIRPSLYAYCREKAGKILEVKEKGHFTKDRTQEYASSGTYYFASGALLKKYLQRQVEVGPKIHGEDYVSTVYQQLLDDGLDVRVFKIPYFLQWGTPEDVADYQYWLGVFKNYPFKAERARPIAKSVSPKPPLQLLMPMAGRGSRFGNDIPKPLVSVLDQSMFLSAVDHLPTSEHKVFVVRKDLEDPVRHRFPDSKIEVLSEVTEGQAITCRIGAQKLLPNQGLLVSSCDHGLLWNQQKWISCLSQDPDVVVWGQRHHPTAETRPKAFAYIDCFEGTDNIRRVSVKEPISDTPRRDLLLVGTFYFKNKDLMIDLIDELERRDHRVNGELYLDSVVNIAIERKLKVRVFESAGYLCWGTPEDLAVFEYWYQYFAGL